MDLDLWTDDFPLSPWGLELGASKQRGGSRDPAGLSCMDGGDAFSLQLTTGPPDTDSLGDGYGLPGDPAAMGDSGWMETGDVGALLAALGGSLQLPGTPAASGNTTNPLSVGQDSLFKPTVEPQPAVTLGGQPPMLGDQPSTIEFTLGAQALQVAEQPSAIEFTLGTHSLEMAEQPSTIEFTTLGAHSLEMAEQPSTIEFINAPSPELDVVTSPGLDESSLELSATSSPDFSYEEVIVADTEFSPPPTPRAEPQEKLIDTLSKPTNEFENTEFLDFGIDVGDFSFSELDLTSLVECTESSVEPLIDASLPTVDVQSTISFSGQSSVATKVKDSSLIQSSPELFKVISNSAPPKQITPYLPIEPPKHITRSPKSPKHKPSKRKPVQEIPEYVILQELDKKGRKKLQNKNAAIRYRQKKKEEAENEKTVVVDLENSNISLKNTVEELEMKINVMKTLMKDMGICLSSGSNF